MSFAISHSMRRARQRTGRANRRGATMVEFALFFIIFLVLTVGLMELGRGVWTYVTLSHAARAAGRYAIVHGGSNPIPNNGTTVEDVAKLNAIGLDNSSITVNVTYDTVNKQGNAVLVEVSYPFQFVTGGLIVQQSTVSMSSTAKMIVLN